MNELDQLPIPLLQWYHENARVLPWRSDPTPYHVWVSEIMLQQTRVAAVLGYYARFMEALPAVADLAAVEEDRLMKLWQGLGYYNRARNLQKAARQIVEEHGGVFPDTYEDIRTLAGVGDYTAGAISSIAFGLPAPAVDGNVLRVVSRLTGDSGDVTRPDTKRRMTAALGEAGCRVSSGPDRAVIRSQGRLRGLRPIRTAPYPGFPTDAQAILMAALCTAEGAPVFVENIFESRYRHVDELARMGADIRVEGRVAVVYGVPRLHGARLRCTDLRGGAALAVAALGAEGESAITGLEHIRRGYEDLPGALAALGAEARLTGGDT